MADQWNRDREIFDPWRKGLGVSYVGDVSLREQVRGIINHLMEGEEKFPVNFRFIENYLPIATTVYCGDRHRIFMDYKKAKRLVRTQRGIARIYAVMAHEIGHMYHHAPKAGADFCEADFTLEFRLEAERAADQHALRMLMRIYPNAREILLEQINNAYKVSIKIKGAKPEDIELATAFVETRRAGLDAPAKGLSGDVSDV